MHVLLSVLAVRCSCAIIRTGYDGRTAAAGTIENSSSRLRSIRLRFCAAPTARARSAAAGISQPHHCEMIATQAPGMKRRRSVDDNCTGPALLLFRTMDLRLHDNPALIAAAAAAGQGVLPTFIWSPREDGHRWGIRGASEVYLKQALLALEMSLARTIALSQLWWCQHSSAQSHI
eukprot:SAG31_NODE_7642_length_1632_cov_1.324853_1_plen_176_part_00